MGEVDDLNRKLISTTKWYKGVLNLRVVQVLTIVEHCYALFVI